MSLPIGKAALAEWTGGTHAANPEQARRLAHVVSGVRELVADDDTMTWMDPPSICKALEELLREAEIE